MKTIVVYADVEYKCRFCNTSLGDTIRINSSAFIVECPKCQKHNHVTIKITKDFVDPNVPII